MASFNLISDIQKLNITNVDHILGKGLQMPFAASNSGSRKIMFGTQLEHRLPLIDPDVAYIQTGYEKQFGIYSSSFNQIDRDYEVIGIVPKFSWAPKHQYYVFLLDHSTNTIRFIERKEYKHISEKYGYLYNNDFLDSLAVGVTVPSMSVIQKSTSFDECYNRKDGRNLLTMYAACEETMEDAIVISESAAKKLSSPLIKKVTIGFNDNEIPLNLYGSIDNYKIFPDINEETVNSILCAFRVQKKEECLYSQSYSRLRDLSISDEKYTVSGRVVDIDICCNAPENLSGYEHNKQLLKYYTENHRTSRDIVDLLKPYIEKGYKMDFELQRLYSISNGVLNGKQYFDERVFTNIVLNITLIEEIPVLRGDKLSNRYGGKGITARVKPDYLMPKTKSGETIDVILNMCGVYGRENAGQLFEISVSYVCLKILEYMQLNILDIGECINMYLTLLSIVAPSMRDEMEEVLSTMSDDECMDFFQNSYSPDEKSFYLVIEPMSENMTIDKIAELYKAFPWIKPETVMMPIMDSAGHLRYIPSRRPLIYGYQYIYRLKQYAEEKFSVTSLSATNIRNENSKSKNSNNYKALYSRTPIRFGDMETGNLIHLGAELVVQMLMLYSTSPHARRLTSEMLTGDPFNIDVKLDMKSKNRNVEILNVYLKTMGLKLVFKRIPKVKINPLSDDYYDDPAIRYYLNPKTIDPLIHYNPDEKIDLDRIMESVNRPINPLVDNDSPIFFYTPQNGRYVPYLERIGNKEEEEKSDK